MTRITFAIGASAVLAVAASATAQSSVRTGPNSSATPFVRPNTGSPVRDVVSIITVGDTIGGYQMLGIPDGMGAFNNSDGSFTLTVAHEIAATVGGQARAHQPAGTVGGAFVSKWNITPGTFAITSAADAMTSLDVTTGGTGSLYQFQRFCSADLAAASAFYNPATGNGTLNHIFLAGEEGGVPGRMMAMDIETGVGTQLQAFDSLRGSWENGVARPFASESTVVVATSDGGTNRVFMYVGTKQSTGTSVEKAGLKNGTGYGMQVKVNGSNVAAETSAFGLATSGTPVYSGTFTFGAGSTDSGTTFLRPEDGAWDPANPADFYFVTTASMTTNSRLWRLRFSDVSNPLAGGTIEALLIGNEGQKMMDNMCVYNTPAGATMMILQEDPGNNLQNAKHHLYNVATDTLTTILECDPARFGNGTTAATAPFNQDEEVSGVIDARDQLGLGWFLSNIQCHYSLTAPLMENGQLYAFYCPECVGICDADLATPYNTIGGEDLASVLVHWGEAYGPADIDRDGVTNGFDLASLLNDWGNCAP
ncbi:MAG: hypothetical protein RI986_961 [Planctomycetota bacterium]|jgi:hypothetical protein